MAFDSTCMFNFKRCLFKYKEREWVLFKGNELYSESIDTIISSEEEREVAFALAHEFLYFFGWQNRCYFHFLADSTKYPASREMLLTTQTPLCKAYRYHRKLRSDFKSIANLPSTEIFKDGLSLYNDALYTNDLFYRFLCLYKILDLPVPSKKSPEEWVNYSLDEVKKTILYTSTKIYIEKVDNLGKFFSDHCRNSITHIHRKADRPKPVISNSSSDYLIIAKACAMIEPFAIYFLKNVISNIKTETISSIEIVEMTC